MKELQDYTTADWMASKTSMNNAAFKRMVRVAHLGGITVPGAVVANFAPRINFEAASDTATYQRVKDMESLTAFNSGVKRWAEKVEGELRQAADARFGHRATDEVSSDFPRLSDSIQANIRFDKQYKLETRSVGFRLARHGVYLHQGAGRGYGGTTGSKWTDKYGRTRTTNDASRGLMGTGGRTAEHWFNDVINRNMAELADIVASYSLDVVINQDSIFLPE